jgi:hypothetical protein
VNLNYSEAVRSDMIIILVALIIFATVWLDIFRSSAGRPRDQLRLSYDEQLVVLDEGKNDCR